MDCVTRYKGTLEALDNDAGKQIIRYLTNKVKPATARTPSIYLIVKVHKPKLCGRPIVPATGWITSPPSVVVDWFLQPLLHSIPWLVKDSTQLINKIEQTQLREEQRDCILLTADISSLYTNIPTTLALQLIRAYLLELNWNMDKVELVMTLLNIVMRNNYFTFRDRTYHQINGTAMGTATGPSYANLFVFLLERAIIYNMLGVIIHFYFRYLDDVLLAVDAQHVQAVQQRFNALHPALKFEFVSSSSSAAFLDLYIYKGERFEKEQIFDVRVHQKSMNLYLYIPFRSFHTTATKKSWIVAELQRYIKFSSHFRDYVQLRQVFFHRLRARGYPRSFLLPLFTSVSYTSRLRLLRRHPPLSSTVNVQSVDRVAGHTPVNGMIIHECQDDDKRMSTDTKTVRTVFVTEYNRMTQNMPLGRIVRMYWERVRAVCPTFTPPLLAWKSAPSLARMLIFRKNQQQRQQKQITQTVNHNFFTPVPTMSSRSNAVRP